MYLVYWHTNIDTYMYIEKLSLTFVRQCPISNLSELLFFYTKMYLNFMYLDQLLFELPCKNTETHTHTHRETLTSTL